MVKTHRERVRFIFNPKEFNRNDYVSMYNRGWRVIGRKVTASLNKPMMITLILEREIDIFIG